ncbi:MAG: histidine triad nucleotide-binding protein [Actinomycetota bacterium]|nr:histidine triad nucleotide-binding protein [Actinomycetota bacterium]
MSDCVFCRIAAGEIPAEVVDETETTLAFRDASPAAPTHVLVVPRSHYPNAAELAVREPDTLVQLVRIAHKIAEAEAIADGYRLVFNTGTGAQQSVFHAHVHVLGGREMSWPPG